jgi:hypothetical protein
MIVASTSGKPTSNRSTITGRFLSSASAAPITRTRPSPKVTAQIGCGLPTPPTHGCRFQLSAGGEQPLGARKWRVGRRAHGALLGYGRHNPRPAHYRRRPQDRSNATRAGSDLERSGLCPSSVHGYSHDYDGSQFSDASVRQIDGDIAGQAPWTSELGVAATAVSVKIIASVSPVAHGHGGVRCSTLEARLDDDRGRYRRDEATDYHDRMGPGRQQV